MLGVVYNIPNGAYRGKPSGMKQIILFISGFCVSGVLFGALYLLIPEGTFKKPLKYVFGVCFICCIIAFFPSSPDFDYSAELAEETSAINDTAVLYAARLTVQTALEKAGIQYRDVRVSAVKDVDGGITGLEVTVVSDEPPQRITAVVQSENIKVSVINE